MKYKPLTAKELDNYVNLAKDQLKRQGEDGPMCENVFCMDILNMVHELKVLRHKVSKMGADAAGLRRKLKELEQ